MNSVAHMDHTFNDSLETKPRCKGGRPRKQPPTQLINGFPTQIAETSYFNVPAFFVDVIAAIDNLAELKVIMYIMRHTWGFREFWRPIRLTTDELMHGRFKKGGERMDSGTGLSKSAVQDGLDRALKHGFIECLVDDHDQARVKHYYRLRMLSEEQEGPESDEIVTTFEKSASPDENEVVTTNVTTVTEENYTELEDNSAEQETEEYDPYAGTIFSPNYQAPEQKNFVSEAELKTTPEVVKNYPRGSYQTPRTQYRTNTTNSLTKEIRNVHPSLNLEEAIRFLPTPDQLPKPKAKSPAFIRNIMTDFSRDLGDHDHIPSNIGQTAKLYRNAGLTEEAFIQALYDAREAAKKATQIKHLNSYGNPNRMPYFFRCLARALNPQDMAR